MFIANRGRLRAAGMAGGGLWEGRVSEQASFKKNDLFFARIWTLSAWYSGWQKCDYFLAMVMYPE